jgi:acyl-CoA synthetase (AMP-forming)/AMP-acid ligase II
VLADYLARGRDINPDGLCIVGAHDGLEYTYREFFELADRIAGGLHGAGLGPGSKVAVYSPNSPTGFAAVVGVITSGAAWVALNPKSDERELADLVNLFECDYVIYGASVGDRAKAILDAASTVRGSIAFDDSVAVGGEFEAWLAPVGVPIERQAFQADRPVMYLGSGGTTGRPKGVVITNRQLTTMSLGFNAHLSDPSPVYLMATPMTHAAGSLAFPVLALGGTVVVHDGVKPAAIFDSIERHRISRIFMPPTAIYALLAAPDVRERDFSSLRSFIYAASPMSVDKLIEAMDVFGPVMTQTFGQTEAPMIATFFGPDEHAAAAADTTTHGRLASCGRQSLVASVEIMAEDGTLLPAGAKGEIVIRGDLVMGGYYGDPVATAAALPPDGWLRTGDIGHRDDDGYVYIVDRARDMIISGGFNVFPSEIERQILSHDSVLDCAVIGVPDPKWGEAVTAVVELKPGADASADELIAMCKAALGSIRTPKAVHFRSLPRSAAGKVLKRKLRDEYWAGQARNV